MDFWTDISFAVILRLLKDSKKVRQYREVMRKIYLNLHAHRLLFLTSDDFEVIKAETEKSK